MKISISFFVIKICLTVTVVAYSAVLGIAHAQTKPLCNKNDNIIFSCTLENKKIVSLCLETPKDEKAPPVLIYNYGTSKNTEMRYPDPKTPASNSFEYALYFRYQVEYYWINFENNGYLYSIARYYSGEENPAKPSVEYQLDVTNIATGKEITTHRCKTIYNDSLSALREILPRCTRTNELGCK